MATCTTARDSASLQAAPGSCAERVTLNAQAPDSFGWLGHLFSQRPGQPCHPGHQSRLMSIVGAVAAPPPTNLAAQGGALQRKGALAISVTAYTAN
jgi:hypothetical protein